MYAVGCLETKEDTDQTLTSTSDDCFSYIHKDEKLNCQLTYCVVFIAACQDY